MLANKPIIGISTPYHEESRGYRITHCYGDAVVAAGGSKQCVFSNLTKYSSSTGFAVYWYYTANGKSYIYRTAL